MSSRHADRQLLFVILALQNAFVSRDDLMSCVVAWLEDKSRLIDQIFLERGILGVDEHKLLTALANKHMEIHGNDAEKSLAAVSSIGSLRDALNQLSDPVIDATLSLIPGASHDASSLDATLTFPMGQVPASPTSRYRVIRPHARGGLGQVSVARDEELNREVALKEIHAQFADDGNSRARFVLEAEVTGSLEHPGIVPVYGLGHYADGRPYYAMRFIRGDSLKEAVDQFHSEQNPHTEAAEKILQLRGLLGRFVDVCNAVEYAHSRGVLHRDLKPGNVMLGRYGETLVVDWGLAKPVGRPDKLAVTDETTLRPRCESESVPTLMGSTIGTPAYMSPEQAAGKLDQVGPASDIYSLGATLYYVLTSKRPFQGKNVNQVLCKVQAGDFPAPREINSQIPNALQAICLRAMATNPQARYASPRALADDVERYLGDEPVTAYSEPKALKLRRWLRNHPRSVAALAATVLVGFSGLIAIAAIVSGKNQALGRANQDLYASSRELAQVNHDLRASNQAERRAREQAQIERERVEAGDRRTREVLHYLSDVAVDKLARFPQADNVRREMVEKVLEYHREFVAGQRDLRAAESDQAAAQFQIGYLAASLGSMAEAADAYQRSVQQREALLAADEADEVTRYDLATTYVNLAIVNLQLNKAVEAQSAIDNAIQHWQWLSEKHPGEIRYAAGIANTYLQRGLLARDLSESLQWHEKAASQYRALLRSQPANARLLGSLSTIQLNIANRLIDLRRFDDAAAAALDAQALNEESNSLDEEGPAHQATGFDAQIPSLLALIEGRRGNDAAAMAYYQAAIEQYKSLLEKHPADAEITHGLTMCLNNRGMLHGRMGRLALAKQDFVDCIATRQKLIDSVPNNASFRSALGNTYRNLAAAELSLGERDSAISHCQQALLIHRQVTQRLPGIPEFQNQLSESEKLMTVIESTPEK